MNKIPGFAKYVWNMMGGSGKWVFTTMSILLTACITGSDLLLIASLICAANMVVYNTGFYTVIKKWWEEYNALEENSKH